MASPSRTARLTLPEKKHYRRLIRYIDPTGQWFIEPQFWQAEGFWNGLARVEVEGYYGYIDHTGQFVWGPAPLPY